MDKTRTIIIDGIEIQTSLTGVEIADLTQKNKELEQQCKKQKEVIDKIKYILNNQINYREFVDIVNDIEDILKEVE